MVKQSATKLNQLERGLPEGLLVDAAWLTRRGYSTALRAHYVASGWLEQPARGVYSRPRGSLRWQQAVVSLQTLLGMTLAVGGRAALEEQGFAHYLASNVEEIHLHGPKPPPTWLAKLPLPVRFVYRNDHRLFVDPPPELGVSLDSAIGSKGQAPSDPKHFVVRPWGQWDWPLVLSTPERAILELLDELPGRESFEQADKLMGSLANLSPRRLQALLTQCRSVKVKRLFFFFADRHAHSWLKHLDKSAIDLGTGKRLLVKGGKLDRKYQITVPENLDAVP